MPSVFVRTMRANTRGVSEFQLRSITCCHSTDRMDVKQRPTAPVGVEYQLSDWAASRRQQHYHIAASATLPSRCVPLLWWGKSPQTPCNNRCERSGVNSGRSQFSSGGGKPPPTWITSPVAPIGVSPSVSPPSISASSAAGPVSYPHYVASWRISPLWGGRGSCCFVAPSPSPRLPLFCRHSYPCPSVPWLRRWGESTDCGMLGLGS